MTISSRHRKRRLLSYSAEVERRAFTLVELLVGVSLSVALLAVIFSTFMVLAKGAVGVGNYSEMSRQSRNILEVFSKDVRLANGLVVSSPVVEGSDVVSNSGITFSYPDYLDSGASQTEVSYVFSPPSGGRSGFLTRVEKYAGTETSQVVLRDMDNFRLKFFKAPGSDFSAVPGPLASINAWAKSIQLDSELRRSVVRTDNTDYIISARFMMRNTSVE